MNKFWNLKASKLVVVENVVDKDNMKLKKENEDDDHFLLDAVVVVLSSNEKKKEFVEINLEQKVELTNLIDQELHLDPVEFHVVKENEEVQILYAFASLHKN